MKVVPCVRSMDLTPEQIRAFRIADNKVAESEWDEEILTQEMAELFEADFDLEVTGFDDKELKELLSDSRLQITDSKLKKGNLARRRQAEKTIEIE